jgi:hypothetical protein
MLFATTIEASTHVGSAANGRLDITRTTRIVAMRGVTTATTSIALSALEFHSDQAMAVVVSSDDAIEGGLGDTHHWDGDSGGGQVSRVAKQERIVCSNDLSVCNNYSGSTKGHGILSFLIECAISTQNEYDPNISCV